MNLLLGEADFFFGGYNELVGQAVCVGSQQLLQDINFIFGAFIVQTKQDDAVMRFVLTMNLVAEILVVCDQYPIFFKGFLNNIVVIHPPCRVVHGENFVPLRLQPFSYSGPVHSSTKKRIYADSTERGIKTVFSSALLANKMQA